MRSGPRRSRSSDTSQGHQHADWRTGISAGAAVTASSHDIPAPLSGTIWRQSPVSWVRGRTHVPTSYRPTHWGAASLRLAASLRGQVEEMLAGLGYRLVVAGVGVARHAEGRISPEHPADLALGELGAVGDDREPAVETSADADAAPVANGHPGRPLGRVKERGENRPVCDGVAAIAHALSLAGWRGHRGGIHVVAPEHERADVAAADEFVEAQPDRVALAQAKPADARGQSLGRDAGVGKSEPAFQRRRANDLQHCLLTAAQVGLVAAEADPPVRADAPGQDRAHILGHEPRDLAGAPDPGRRSLCP